MSPPLCARPACDPDEERKIRKLAGARHAPADWILRARMISLSWAGKHVTGIAAELGCHPKTVREHLHRFNVEGIDGLGDLPIPGRLPRLTEDDRSVIIALARSDPPGRPVRGPDGVLEAPEETGPPTWTLNSLTEAARERDIEVHRSQVRTILLREGVRWRYPRSWAHSDDLEFAPKGQRSSGSTPTRRRVPR